MHKRKGQTRQLGTAQVYGRSGGDAGVNLKERLDDTEKGIFLPRQTNLDIIGAQPHNRQSEHFIGRERQDAKLLEWGQSTC